MGERFFTVADGEVHEVELVSEGPRGRLVRTIANGTEWTAVLDLWDTPALALAEAGLL